MVVWEGSGVLWQVRLLVSASAPLEVELVYSHSSSTLLPWISVKHETGHRNMLQVAKTVISPAEVISFCIDIV